MKKLPVVARAGRLKMAWAASATISGERLCAATPAPPDAAAEPAAAKADTRAPRRKTKLSFNEARELEQIPARLEALEQEQAALAARLADPALYQDRTADLKALNARHAEIEEELSRLLERWEALEAAKAALS